MHAGGELQIMFFIAIIRLTNEAHMLLFYILLATHKLFCNFVLATWPVYSHFVWYFHVMPHYAGS